MAKQHKKKKQKLWGARNWLVWLVAAMTTLVLTFVAGVTLFVIYAQYDGAPRSAEIIAQITEQPPTPAVTLTPFVEEVVERNEVAKPVASPSPTALPSATPVPTEPPAATATAAPTVVITPLPTGGVLAERVDQPLVVDGNLEGWTDIPSFTSSYRVYNNDSWDQTDDLQTFWRLAWDDLNLYLSALVIDDVHVQIRSGDLSYLGDSVELQIDTQLRLDLSNQLSTDDYQLVFSPGDFAENAPSFGLFRGTPEGQMVSYGNREGIKVSAEATDSGYVLEAAVPWTVLGVRPTVDLELGIALNANDNDVPFTAQQEVMKSHIATRKFAAPDTWGVLILDGDELAAD